jgi:hypothetical protein
VPLRVEERPRARAFWRSHFEVWELSGLTQREYCERHGLSLKSFAVAVVTTDAWIEIGASCVPTDLFSKAVRCMLEN